MRLLLLTLTLGFVLCSRAGAAVLINEIDADQTGTDTLEFVELYDEGAGNTSLQGLYLVLFNGADDTAYFVLELSSYATTASGFFVVGNVPGSDVAPGVPTSWLQNGADAVTLYTAIPGAILGIGTPAGTTLSGTLGEPFTLVDAVVYATGDPLDAGLLGALGEIEQLDEDQNGSSATESLQWSADPLSGWSTGIPTPGSPNFNTGASPIPSLSLGGLALLVGLVLAAAARARWRSAAVPRSP